MKDEPKICFDDLDDCDFKLDCDFQEFRNLSNGMKCCWKHKCPFQSNWKNLHEDRISFTWNGEYE